MSRDGPGVPLEGRCLVLGATGFVGRWVVRALERCGEEVVPHARSEERALRVLGDSEAAERLVSADLALPGEAGRLIERVRPSVVFNLVGYGVDRDERDEESAFRINAALVGDVCRAAASYGDRGGVAPKLVHVGSALEYGRAGGDLAEETEPSPTTLYGRSKLAGTREVRRLAGSLGLRAITARLFTVYGPGEHEGRLLPSLLAAAETGSPVDLTLGRQERDFTYVEDVAAGLVRLASCGTSDGSVVNLATGRLLSVRGFVEVASDVLGIPRSSLRFGALPTREEEMSHGPVSVDRLRAWTGWSPPTSVREGILRTRRHLDRGAPARTSRRPGRGDG